MMRIGWSSEKKKVDIGRLIDCFGLWEFRQKFRHCWNFRHCEALKKPKQSH